MISMQVYDKSQEDFQTLWSNSYKFLSKLEIENGALKFQI